MGAFFSNLQIKKTEHLQTEEIVNLMTEFMSEKGCTKSKDASDADYTVYIYLPQKSPWITVCSDAFELNTAKDSNKIAGPISKALNTDTLMVSCYDSDYLFLNLVNEHDHTDAWVNVGDLPGIQHLRRTGFHAWKDKVKDMDSFKDCIEHEYICAEEVMEPFGKQMDLPKFQGCLSSADIDQIEDRTSVVKLYFSVKEDHAEIEATKLRILYYGLTPCRPSENNVVTAFNEGGGSKGLAVFFAGDYIEQDEIQFSDVSFVYRESGKFIRIPITLSKRHTEQGDWILYWEDKDFWIPSKVNSNLSKIKRVEQTADLAFSVHFTPMGDVRKFLDIKVGFAPLANWKDGQCCWYVWKNAGSKHEYIEEHNQNMLKLGLPPRMLDLLNPEDYDI